nr:MAG TPA: hypothetical protein [Caudoviricetes sp.]
MVGRGSIPRASTNPPRRKQAVLPCGSRAERLFLFPLFPADSRGFPE